MSIYFYGCVSLDGYLADANNRLDWLHQTGAPEETNYAEFYSQMDMMIMGKKTYDEIVGIAGIESLYAPTQNYVFTHEKELALKSFQQVEGDVADFVRQLPADKNVWIVGGNSILAPLLNENMVDKLYVQVAPVLLGKGIPLFTQDEDVKRFKLVGLHQYGQFAEMVFEK
ncbi:dihydrofolate reductase family protein [Listeria sp. ILCC792]|uniref:dihydrofolate reductase family protein n=1 Tax=Listeria sp. ILCC792 TaxID=1918331 RepID=UPI000B58FDDD|nr:dihydrofolate reductase family protein [Listeria sp. ILCC792]